ncbi:MAG: type IV pilin [Candidatus Pacearchaeota archaeon]|nr:type IV pilin [Candidatus Pacearchaeota archaeon]
MLHKSKRGISAIIGTLLLIVLTIALVAVVWTVVNNMVSQKITQSSACFGNFNSITLNNQYSCFNSSANKVQFSLNIGDVAVDGVLVSMTGPAGSESVTITNTPTIIPGLTYLGGSSGQDVQLPGKNAGKTYVYDWTGGGAANSVQIAPIVKGQQCSSSDSISSLDDCNLLA